MSGISFENKDWLLEHIKTAQREGKRDFITSGGPCDEKLIQYLSKKGYIIEEFSDFEIISWNKDTINSMKESEEIQNRKGYSSFEEMCKHLNES